MKHKLIIVAISLFFLFSIELLCYLINSNQKFQIPFLVNKELLKKRVKSYTQLKNQGYTLVDPLLGWGTTEEVIKKANFQAYNNSVFLPSSVNCSKKTKIIITGGSTSDLIYNNKNWPIIFQKKLDENNICADVYVFATGGYNSGQELLKILRDGLLSKGDIHISYSGANECISSDFVSRQEYSFHLNVLKTSGYSLFFPNTIFLLRNYAKNETNLTLYVNKKNDPEEFWKNNMSSMHALSVEKSYKFYGILQPVLGINPNLQKNLIDKNSEYVNNNIQFYSKIKPVVDSSKYLYNLAFIFDESGEDVFLDDCHIKDDYQKVIADKIYEIILNEKIN